MRSGLQVVTRMQQPPSRWCMFAGLYGCMHGLKNSPNKRPRILVNSVLNGSGKYGAKTGNAAGVLAMIYTVLERQFEDSEIDKLPGTINRVIGYDIMSRHRYDWLIPATTAFATGVVFTLPRAGMACSKTSALALCFHFISPTHIHIFTLACMLCCTCAVTMRGLDKHYITFSKRVGVVVSGGVAAIAGVAALAVVGPVVFGHRSPYRFAS